MSVAFSSSRPKIDGVLDEGEWREAIQCTLNTELATRIFIQTDGTWLFIACDAPAEISTAGYDQFRLYLHAGPFSKLVNERVHIGRAGSLTSIRQTRFRWQGEPPTEENERWKRYKISDWGIYQYAVGTSSMFAGHRQYEGAIHLGEAGLTAGSPFTLYVEVETDPLRDDKGKFVEQRHPGTLGNEDNPEWLMF